MVVWICVAVFGPTATSAPWFTVQVDPLGEVNNFKPH